MDELILESMPLSAPVLALNDVVLFPGIVLPVIIASTQGIAAVNEAINLHGKHIYVVSTQSNGKDLSHIEENDLYTIGTKAIINRINKLENGISMSLTGIERIRIDRYTKKIPFFFAESSIFPVEENVDPETDAVHREILKIFDEMRHSIQTEAGMPISELIQLVHTPLQQIYLMAIVLGFDVEKNQTLLEAKSRKELSKLMHNYILYESRVQRIREKITNEVSSDMGKEQREYVLRRQLHEIQKELGDTGENNTNKQIEEEINKAKLPPHVNEEIGKQFQRLNSLAEASQEYQLLYSYIKNIIELPWNKKSDDILELDRVENILNQDHYNLSEVKERIIEQLAVLKLNPSAKSPILCFVGPPGVGKTSLGESIAKALGRKFERLSLGGIHDEAELRGHRRTYVGAMPGRIMEAIRRAEVNNPLIMLDEIDKMSSDFRGDPTAALMEVLDPVQNKKFHDNYLDIPFDLSNVFFITTANTTSNIQGPLLDRMEIIRLAGYTDYEKLNIAKKFLIPKNLIETGINDSQLVINDEAIDSIIHEYTREAGVRDLQRSISQISRKVATSLARGNIDPVKVTRYNIHDYLGREKVFQEKIRENWGIGISTSLAWTEAGGDIIYIESCFLPDRKKEIKITGNLGEIMRESVTCALSYIWSHPRFKLNQDDIKEAGIHIHVPAGAIPKDGPSAGIAIVSAIASLYLNRPVKKSLAMTGEVTLSGLILPIGGVKEKILAARRAGIYEIILPLPNQKDLEDIPEHVQKEMKFHLVTDIEEVLHLAIPNHVPIKSYKENSNQAEYLAQI